MSVGFLRRGALATDREAAAVSAGRTDVAAFEMDAARDRGYLQLMMQSRIAILAGPTAFLLAVTLQAHLTAQTVTWSQVATTGPTARAEASMSFDSQRGRMVLFGGILPPPTGAVNDTHEWDGTLWNQMTPATSAPASLSQPMAYDSQRGVSVLYGGGFTAQADTWEYNGVTWTERATTGPSPRGAFSMSYDSQRGVMVLFGGISNLNGDLLGETWEWDGVIWAQRLSVTEPQVRGGHSSAYDSARDVTVLFGGFGGIDPVQNIIILYGDTWEWDGTDWTQISAGGGSAPAGREGQGMVYDAQRDRVVMFGGADISNVLNDTWTWDGSSWTNLNLSPAPSPREGHSMAYNSQTGSILVFGGFGAPPGPILIPDTWELAASSPTSAVAVTYGAGCGSPPLEIAPDPGALPVLGTTAIAEIDDIPPASLGAFVGLGWSNVFAGPFPLPFSMAQYGMPGCDLLQSSERSVSPTVPTGPGRASYSLPIPNMAGLIGLQVYVQGWASAPGQNAANVILSNALAWTIGNT